ncbi:MAG: M48 family metallopeptidase [Sphingorhabdus sp.]
MALTSSITHAGPKAEEVTAYRALVGEDQRLANVAHRLARANAPFCASTEQSLGWMLHDIAQYPDPEVARAAFGFALPIQISAVADDSAASRAGLRVDDALVQIDADNGHVRFNKPSNPSYALDYKRMELLLIGLDALLANNPKGDVTITYLRDGTQASARVQPVAECASDFQIDTKDGLDAGADGERVRVTIGLVRYAIDDAELAAVVAHEISHNLLSHRARLDGLKRGKTKALLATEIEADRLSVWLMANAGYDPKAALRFWERYGRKTGLGIFSDGTHLRWKNRVKVMQAEIDLMAKTEKRDGLLPPPLLVGG